jgi:hypothetical protein
MGLRGLVAASPLRHGPSAPQAGPLGRPSPRLEPPGAAASKPAGATCASVAAPLDELRASG